MNYPTYSTCDVCGNTLSHGGDCATCIESFDYFVGLPDLTYYFHKPSDYRGEEYIWLKVREHEHTGPLAECIRDINRMIECKKMDDESPSTLSGDLLSSATYYVNAWLTYGPKWNWDWSADDLPF